MLLLKVLDSVKLFLIHVHKYNENLFLTKARKDFQLQRSHCEDLNVCDDGTLVQILCFWTLSIVLSSSKNRPVNFSKQNVSETGFSLRLQVKPTQFGPIDRASPYLRNVVF
jgi:hypothetical protein